MHGFQNSHELKKQIGTGGTRDENNKKIAKVDCFMKKKRKQLEDSMKNGPSKNVGDGEVGTRVCVKYYTHVLKRIMELKSSTELERQRYINSMVVEKHKGRLKEKNRQEDAVIQACASTMESDDDNGEDWWRKIICDDKSPFSCPSEWV